MSSDDADTNSGNNEYGQYDDLEAALVIAAADADARSHVQVRSEEEQEEGASANNGVKEEYQQETLHYYQNDEQKPEEKVEESRKGTKRKLSEDEVEEDIPGNVFFLNFTFVVCVIVFLL